MNFRERFLAWYLTGPLRRRLWSELRAVGASSIFRTAPIYFIGVPIAVAIIESVQYRWHIRLPFTWELLFYSALFITIGNILYVSRCPRFIKEYSSYRAYSELGKTKFSLRIELYQVLMDYIDQFTPYDLQKNFQHLDSELGVKFPQPINIEELETQPGRAVSVFMSADVSQVNDAELFEYIKDTCDTLNRHSRTFCFLSYALGLLLLLLVSIENVASVISYSYGRWTMEDWIPFTGHALFRDGSFKLFTEEDPDAFFRLDADDVKVEHGILYIHVGAVAREIQIPLNSPVRQNLTASPQMNPQCGVQGSQCYRGVEICCNTKKVVGSCTGRWFCRP